MVANCVVPFGRISIWAMERNNSDDIQQRNARGKGGKRQLSIIMHDVKAYFTPASASKNVSAIDVFVSIL